MLCQLHFEDILFGFCQEHRTQLVHIVSYLISSILLLLRKKVSNSALAIVTAANLGLNIVNTSLKMID